MSTKDLLEIHMAAGIFLRSETSEYWKNTAAKGSELPLWIRPSLLPGSMRIWSIWESVFIRDMEMHSACMPKEDMFRTAAESGTETAYALHTGSAVMMMI